MRVDKRTNLRCFLLQNTANNLLRPHNSSLPSSPTYVLASLRGCRHRRLPFLHVRGRRRTRGFHTRTCHRPSCGSCRSVCIHLHRRPPWSFCSPCSSCFRRCWRRIFWWKVSSRLHAWAVCDEIYVIVIQSGNRWVNVSVFGCAVWKDWNKLLFYLLSFCSFRLDEGINSSRKLREWNKNLLQLHTKKSKSFSCQLDSRSILNFNKPEQAAVWVLF